MDLYKLLFHISVQIVEVRTMLPTKSVVVLV